MAFEQLFLVIGIGVGMGALISVVSFLATNAKWNNRKFAYTMVISTFTAFGIIEGVEGGVGEENIIKVILLIAGATFFTNKAVHMAKRVKAIDEN